MSKYYYADALHIYQYPNAPEHPEWNLDSHDSCITVS